MLELDIYAILTQGSNEYYDESSLHISETLNHISLNSLGVPFSDLMVIEEAVRLAIRSKFHDPAELYIDDKLYHSLKFKCGFNKNDKPKFKYKSKMETKDSYYFPNKVSVIEGNIETK